MRALRWLVIAIVVVTALVGCVAVVARFSDGPIGPFPGAKLGGERVAAPVTDWAPLLAGVDLIDVEVSPDDPRSVRASYILHDGRLYVPAMFGKKKTWPKLASADPRVVLRIDGKLYERRAVRVTDPDELRPLVRSFDGDVEGDLSGISTWYFRMDPPDAAAARD